jgi:hypothetical protein
MIEIIMYFLCQKRSPALAPEQNYYFDHSAVKSLKVKRKDFVAFVIFLLVITD